MEERLQKLISSCGLASRRTAEAWISQGRVTVNGSRAALGDRADLERDRVEVDGVPLRPRTERTYLMLNKPRGYVTTLSDEKGRRTVASLVSGCGRRVWPVGRLDLDSEGLLLFTDDGELTHGLLHPSGEVEKEYLVWVAGDVDRALPILTAPMELDGEPIAPAGAQERGRDPALCGHPPGEEPAGAPDVRPGGPGGPPPQAGAGGAGLAGPGAEAGPVAASDRGGAAPSAGGGGDRSHRSKLKFAREK